MYALTLLWISLIVCMAVMTIIALNTLDEQRRLWFGTRGRHAGTARKPGARYVVSVRRTLSTVAGLIAAISRHGRDRLFDAARSTWSALWHVQWRAQREHAARLLLRAMSSGTVRRPVEAAAKPVAPAPPTSAGATVQAADRIPTTAETAGEGVVRVDADGRLHSPDAVARRLLHWNGGTLTLGDVLAGGKREAAALLESVGRREVIEQNVRLLAGASSQHVHITALASRNRDGSLSGALLILHQL